jgi:hypothetical protein
MPSVTTQKYHMHNAKQFVESLSEGFRTYGANTITANANSTVLTISGNVFNTMRVGDILMVNAESRLITNIASNGTAVTVNTAFSTELTPQLFKTREQLAAYDSYYLFIGRSTPWANSDTEPETPTDSVYDTAYNYLRDTLAISRITDDNLIYVIPRHNWTNGSSYLMYDHRNSSNTVLSNTTHFSYVLTSANDVFKCIHDGRTNSTFIPESIEEPSISDVPSINSIITTEGENQTELQWKYMYSLSSEDVNKYLTGDYMPLHDASDVLDPSTGDVQNDSSALFQTFEEARNSGNGAIYVIIVDEGGSDYNPSNPPSVNIDGDGSSAVASVELTGNAVTAVRMVAYGQNYSFANVTITTSNSGSGAMATAIISPRNTFANTSGLHYVSNHNISNKDELLSSHVMLYVELDSGEGGNVTTENEYRRVGILKNPLLQNGEVATGNVYDMTTHLTISTADNFNKDEIVFQPSTGAYGVVVEQTASILRVVHTSALTFTASESANTTIIGIGNGNTESVLLLSDNGVPSSLPEIFDDIITASGATATVSNVETPDIIAYTGEVLFVNHVQPIIRANNQSEVIRTILAF